MHCAKLFRACSPNPQCLHTVAPVVFHLQLQTLVSCLRMLNVCPTIALHTLCNSNAVCFVAPSAVPRSCHRGHCQLQHLFGFSMLVMVFSRRSPSRAGLRKATRVIPQAWHGWLQVLPPHTLVSATLLSRSAPQSGLFRSPGGGARKRQAGAFDRGSKAQ